MADTAIVRIFNTFGPRMRPEDGRAIPTFVRQALSGEALTVSGNGSQTRSVCYVDDLVDGVLRLAWSSHAGPMNIGNPGEMSVLALARLIIQVTGSESDIVFVPRPQDDPHVRKPDISLARETLGWEPRVAVTEGLIVTAKWFEDRPSPRRSDVVGATAE